MAGPMDTARRANEAKRKKPDIMGTVAWMTFHPSSGTFKPAARWRVKHALRDDAARAF